MKPEREGTYEGVRLLNATKIKFCNAYLQLCLHCIGCRACERYTSSRDGDLCDAGKAIIAREMAYADTNPVTST